MPSVKVALLALLATPALAAPAGVIREIRVDAVEDVETPSRNPLDRVHGYPETPMVAGPTADAPAHVLVARDNIYDQIRQQALNAKTRQDKQQQEVDKAQDAYNKAVANPAVSSADRETARQKLKQEQDTLQRMKDEDRKERARLEKIECKEEGLNREQTCLTEQASVQNITQDAAKQECQRQNKQVERDCRARKGLVGNNIPLDFPPPPGPGDITPQSVNPSSNNGTSVPQVVTPPPADTPPGPQPAQPNPAIIIQPQPLPQPQQLPDPQAISPLSIPQSLPPIPQVLPQPDPQVIPQSLPQPDPQVIPQSLPQPDPLALSPQPFSPLGSSPFTPQSVPQPDPQVVPQSLPQPNPQASTPQPFFNPLSSTPFTPQSSGGQSSGQSFGGQGSRGSPGNGNPGTQAEWRNRPTKSRSVG
ncbi:hypothetical protein ACKVWC_004865 [Pyricularia oryzae]